MDQTVEQSKQIAQEADEPEVIDSPEAQSGQNKVKEFIELDKRHRELERELIEESVLIQLRANELGELVFDKLPRDDSKPLPDPGRSSPLISGQVYDDERSGTIIASNGAKIEIEVRKHRHIGKEYDLDKDEMVDVDIEGTNTKYALFDDVQDSEDYKIAVASRITLSNKNNNGSISVYGRTANLRNGKNGEAPPDRDPLDAARAGLEFFIEQADKLKLAEPENQDTFSDSSSSSATTENPTQSHSAPAT